MKYQIKVTKVDGTVWKNNRCGKGFDLDDRLYKLMDKYYNEDNVDDVEIIPFEK